MNGSAFRLAVFLVVASTSFPAAAQEVDGTWKVTYVTGGTVERGLAIVQLRKEGSKLTGTLVAGNPGNLELKSATLEGTMLRMVFQAGTAEMLLEATAPSDKTKRILGVAYNDNSVYPVRMTATEETKLDPKTSVNLLPCPPFQQAQTLLLKAASLRARARQAKEPDEKATLLKQADEADLVARKDAPKLLREVLEKFTESPAVFEAAVALTRMAKAAGITPDELKGWTAPAGEAAKAYGPRLEAACVADIAAALLTQEGFAAQAVDYARQAERAATPQASAAHQSRTLTILSRALRKAGRLDEAKPYESRLAKLEEALDREYLAKEPAFKAEPYNGRRGQSERAVFMELFTGAMCPPCVAADMAFDVLQKTFKPGELVLIQYHMHIPGPDPLTNADTEARWSYYREAFPMEIRGVPSSLFNGKPAAGGGGGTAQAEKKYADYRDVIEPLLEEPAAAKLNVKAARAGERIDIHVDVAGLAEPGPGMKLRILLTEETVRYLGSNKIRLHHNVVRAFPGGVEGKALTQAASKHAASISLDELRGQLTAYLDDYETNTRPFVNPARPLDFQKLRVIAVVQDDQTHAILQSVQVSVD